MANEERLDLIDRKALLAELDKFANPMPNKSGYEFLHGIATAITEIEESPTVDAVEVVHAHWEDGCAVDCYGNIAYKSIECSHCEEIFKIESRTREYWKARFKVCPFCSAKMDGGNEDA